MLPQSEGDIFITWWHLLVWPICIFTYLGLKMSYFLFSGWTWAPTWSTAWATTTSWGPRTTSSWPRSTPAATGSPNSPPSRCPLLGKTWDIKVWTWTTIQAKCGFTVALRHPNNSIKTLHNKPRGEKFLEVVYIIFEAHSVVFRPRRTIHENF